VLVAAICGVGLAALAGLAFATTTDTLVVAKNVQVIRTKQSVVANSHGVTVYWLNPETTKHLLCKPSTPASSSCFHFWPPVTVRSAKTKLTAAPGVKGKLGILHRNGIFQVTLNGHPLYTFLVDRGIKGSARGEGVKGFGGTWHVTKVHPSKASTTTTTTTTSTSTTSTTSTTTTYP
jgi:predicted lipoprotein with Yx(FWY)xxD motif